MPAAWPDGFPFLTADSPVMQTPAGDIPYETQGLKLAERYARHEGGTSRVPLCINGEDAADFLLYGPGYTVRSTGGSLGGPVSLKRYLPYKNPSTETQYLVELSTAQNGPVDVDATLDNWPVYSWLVYNADFSTLPFDVKSEAECPTLSDGTPNELARYVIRRPVFTSRERKVPQFTLETDDEQPIMESGWIIDGTVDWLYTWVECPIDAFPFATVASTIGKINNAAFDTVTPRGRNMATGTALLAGVQGTDQPYIGPDGGRYIDCTMLIRFRPAGWNKYVRPDGSTVGWRYVNDHTSRPYKEADFQLLFKPV